MTAEIELLVSGTTNGVWTSGEMVFTSTADGLEYSVNAGSGYETSFTSILAGLVRPIEEAYGPGPAHLRARHSGRTGIRPAGRAALGDRRTPASPSLHKICLAARIQAAYDFYIVPAFSVGAAVGYRYLQADFAGSVYSADFDFLEAGGGANTLTRLTEVTLPVRPVAWSSPYFGLRCGFRI